MEKVLIGTAETDENGIAKITYTGQGLGDVQIVAECGNVSSTSYNIEDCIDYQPMISNIHESKWIIPPAIRNSSIYGYSANGWKIGNVSNYSSIVNTEAVTVPCSMEFTLTEVNYNINPSPIVTVKHTTTNNILSWTNSSSSQAIIFDDTNTGRTIKIGSKYRTEVTQTNITLYEDDVQIITKTKSGIPNQIYFGFDTGANRMSCIKDYKINLL